MRKENFSYGTFYYNDFGQLHREDGPAIEYTTGGKRWYFNNLLHREDGPAAEFSDGSKFWYIRDKQINCKTQKEFLQLMKMKAFW